MAKKVPEMLDGKYVVESAALTRSLYTAVAKLEEKLAKMPPALWPPKICPKSGQNLPGTP